MPPSAPLRKHWRSLDAGQLAVALRQANCAVDAFAAATAASGSLLQSWVQGEPVFEFDHYPSGDVIDSHTGSQFYYHSHRQEGLEHGHLHLFWHATSSGRRRYFKDGQVRWNRAAPTHLFAISLDSRGLPVALFTVNRWVTDGYWFDAATTQAMVDRFRMGALPGHEHACAWLTGFARFYRPVLAELLQRRDQRLGRGGGIARALDNRRLEVLSAIRVDWMADLDALQRLATRRGLPAYPDGLFPGAHGLASLCRSAM